MICRANNIDLYYEKSGEGEPLLLLHGNGETHEIFDKAIPILNKRFTVYALDSRGHGRSGSVPEFHYADMAEDVSCLIRELKLSKPILCGFSDGGIIGLLIAAKEPELLSQMILCGANTRPDGIRKGWLRLFRAIQMFVKDPKMKMMLEEPDITDETLKKIAVPIAIIAGSRDMIRRSHTEQIAGNLPNGTLRILKGEGHGSYVIHSGKIAEVILEAVCVR